MHIADRSIECAGVCGRITQAGDIVLVILGNKADMAREEAVPEEEARAFAASFGAEHMRVSAKTGQGVEAAFIGTSRRALAAAHARPPDAAAGVPDCVCRKRAAQMPHGAT